MRALAGHEKALGSNHTSTLDTVNYLGNLYRNRSKLDVAEQMYMRAQLFQERPSVPEAVSKVYLGHCRRRIRAAHTCRKVCSA